MGHYCTPIHRKEYGHEDSDGLSPTEREFIEAGRLRKRRLVLVKDRDDKERHPKMQAFVRRVGDEVVRRRFENTEELLRLLYGSLIQYLQDRGFVAAKDFDAKPCDEATLSDISVEKVKWFIEKARAERSYALTPDASRKEVLSHLNLLVKSKPTCGAVLLFNKNPERFIRAAEITCLHFYGTEIVKPIPSQQVYHGPLFDVVDKAVDFVNDRLRRTVEPSDKSAASTITYEVPFRVIREAIVNAVAHRNYASRSGIQVMIFADRIEVWNPGGLPEDLTVDMLRKPHPSVPRNRLLCEPLYLAHYIERAGTGTLDMVRLCTEAGLPEPDFRSDGERFSVIIWRDWLTAEVFAAHGLNSRQRQAIEFLRARGTMTNTEYQKTFSVAKRTVSQDLRQLVDMGLIHKIGTTGKGVHYRLAKGAPKGHKGHGPSSASKKGRQRGIRGGTTGESRRVPGEG
ncbi:MAG: ATP-binding protein [Syntrophales bacterium]|nr:ATP-binding protein [Syntrophales bacterium]